MKQILFLSLVVFFSVSIQAQSLAKEDMQILKTIVDTNATADLFPELGGLRFLWIQKQLSTKTFTRNLPQGPQPEKLILSDAEKSFVDSSLKAANHFRWTRANVSQAGLKLNVVKLGIDRTGDPQTYAIMKPIFLRNNSFCFTFYSTFTKTQGYHNLSLWQKVNGRWTLWKLIADVLIER